MFGFDFDFNFGGGFGSSDPFRNSFGPNAPTTKWVMPVVAVIVGIAILVLIIYTIIVATTARPALTVLGPIDLFSPSPTVTVIDRTKTKSAMAGTYTLSFFIRIDAVPDMRSDATPLMTWPGVWELNYNPAHEELVWIVQQSPSQSAPSSLMPERVALKGVPLQRWTQITLGFEGRTMDMYVNGTLVRSYSLANLPPTPPASSSSITLVAGGLMGQLAYVQLWSRRLTVGQVASNYVDTADSVGRPYLGPEFITALTQVKLPNLFNMKSPDGTPTAAASQQWEFPYA